MQSKLVGDITLSSEMEEKMPKRKDETVEEYALRHGYKSIEDFYRKLGADVALVEEVVRKDQEAEEEKKLAK